MGLNVHLGFVCVCVLTRLTRSDLRYQSTNFFHRHCVADSKHLQVLFIGGALLTWGHRHGNVCCTPNLLRSTHIKAPPSDRSIIHRRPCDWIVTGVTPIRDGPLLASCHFLLFVLLFFIPTSSYNRNTEALQPRICYKTDVTALSVLISIFCLWLDTTRVAGENRANTVTHSIEISVSHTLI